MKVWIWYVNIYPNETWPKHIHTSSLQATWSETFLWILFHVFKLQCSVYCMCIKTIDFLQDDCIRGSTMKVAGLIKSTHYSFSLKGHSRASWYSYNTFEVFNEKTVLPFLGVIMLNRNDFWLGYFLEIYQIMDNYDCSKLMMMTSLTNLEAVIYMHVDMKHTLLVKSEKFKEPK